MQQRQRRAQREVSEAEGRDMDARRRSYGMGTQVRTEGVVGEVRGRGDDQGELEVRRRPYGTGAQMRAEGMVGEVRGRGEDQGEQGPLQRQRVWQHQYEGKGRGHTRGGLNLSNQPND